MSEKKTAIHWFRKGLRLHDNPALIEACRRSQIVYPVFILDPHFAKPEYVGVNRYAFLLESLKDIDISLKNLGSRLYVIKGKPEEKLPHLFKEWNIDLLTYEVDTEPYAIKRDNLINSLAMEYDIEVSVHHSHTLRDLDQYDAANKGNKILTYQSFCKIHDSLGIGSIRKVVDAPTTLCENQSKAKGIYEIKYDIPDLSEMGYPNLDEPLKFPGGEQEALRRLDSKVIQQHEWVAKFEKPKTSPNALEPSTTVLSPYLKFGCLSSAKFYHILTDIYSNKKEHSKPPVSLHGQLLWREFFYFNAHTVPNFGLMSGNPNCKQIPWDRDMDKIIAWKNARTGYPWIDACMTQLRQEGWLHHLGRHAVACFLTRGDLWQHWEEGAKVFEELLLDADWSINRANWQWLSCSSFFYQYFRCYSPISFGKKTDKSGHYIRKYIPQLKNMPDKFIYEPWSAPLAVQKSSGCIVGQDYPNRIVIHENVVKVNMDKMKSAYDSMKQKKTVHTECPSSKKAKIK
jgi:cryptochrome